MEDQLATLHGKGPGASSLIRSTRVLGKASDDAPRPLRMAIAVREAYRSCLNKQGGFLPAATPVQELPGPWAGYVRACRELPRHYHGVGAHVRPWLDERFAAWDAAWEASIDSLSQGELDTLMTVLSIMSHAYRWDSAPPRSEEYQRTSIQLPRGLAAPWEIVANRLGIPRVGGLYHILLNNWRLRSRPGGGSYTNAEFVGDNIEVMFPYLSPPEDRQGWALFASIVETEARGAAALRTIVRLMSAAARRNGHETAYLLDKLRAEIQEINRVLGVYLRKQLITADGFLTLIQPTLVWGLDEGSGPLEGASGSQTPIFQALDAVLGLKRESHTGKTILEGRRYLPPGHRRFLDTLDEASFVVRSYVDDRGDPGTTELYNDCVKGVQLWRRMHQKRGALYLKGNGEGAAADYVSVGQTITSPEDRVRVFEDAMQQRLAETTDALFPTDGAAPATFETTFEYLTAEDRKLLLSGGEVRQYAAEETIVKEGARGQAIFIVQCGAVRVESAGRKPRPIMAYLDEGEVFGEMSFLDNQRASASVVADVDCELTMVPREHVFKLAAVVDGFAGRFFQSLATLLSRRLRRANALLGLKQGSKP